MVDLGKHLKNVGSGLQGIFRPCQVWNFESFCILAALPAPKKHKTEDLTWRASILGSSQGSCWNFQELPGTSHYPGSFKNNGISKSKRILGSSYLPAFPKEVPGTSHWPRVVEKKMRWQNPKGFGEVPNLPAFWEFTNLSAFWEVPQEVPRTFDQGKLKNNTISKFEGILGISHLPGIWEV